MNMGERSSDEKQTETRKTKLLNVKEDWSVIPYLLLVIVGVIITIIDFAVLQKRIFRFNVIVICGLVLLIIAGIMRFLPRRSLIKAGFGNIWNTVRLQIVEDHRLVTDGYYQYIRHPIYVGEIARTYCLTFIFSSLYGFVIMTLTIVFLLKRIQIEEQMLLEEFGEEYEEYQRKTKKLIPFIY